MEDNSGVEELISLFKGRDWFHSVGHDQYGRLVVYTNFMCHETLHDVPDRVAGKQVLVHFAASMLATREQFTDTQVKPRLELVPEETFDSAVELDSSELENDVDDLCRELDKLEKKCGSNILQHIFYEVHDGKNSLTNFSTRYPEVREKMETLYAEYGFDIIYEELDG